MCMQLSAVRPHQKWRWAGEEIVFDPRVPAARYVPGSRKKHYPIDIRGYLGGLHNAVLQARIDDVYRQLSAAEQPNFILHEPGAFDFRVRKVLDSLGELKYIKSGRRFDQWLFPEETLAQEGGDCEDLAFLIAALLEESGVMRHCIRVALGSIVDRTDPNKPRSYDHAWVVYQTEGGGWYLIEPLTVVNQGGAKSGRTAAKRRGADIAQKTDVEYVPYFVFNRDHLWRVRSPDSRTKPDEFADYLAERKQFWSAFDPSFAMGVHNDIFDEALTGMTRSDLQTVKLQSFWVDTNVLRYDPRDHFDFAYIEQGWGRVEQRLKKKDLQHFALAAHAIGDFYAHSMYAHFAAHKTPNAIEIYDPAHVPAIDNGFIFDALDLPGCTMSKQQAKARWGDKIISGQWWRWYTTYPNDIQNPAELNPRRCLPDHDMLAVDGPTKHSPDHIYHDDAKYAEQFALRKRVAVEHLRKVYEAWRG